MDGEPCIFTFILITGSQCNFLGILSLVFIFQLLKFAYSHVVLSTPFVSHEFYFVCVCWPVMLFCIPVLVSFISLCVLLVLSRYYLFGGTDHLILFKSFLLLIILSPLYHFQSSLVENIYSAIGLVSLSRSVLQLFLWLSKLFSLSFCLYHSSLYKLHQT